MTYHGAGANGDAGHVAVRVQRELATAGKRRRPNVRPSPVGLHRSMTEAGTRLQQMLPLCNTLLQFDLNQPSLAPGLEPRRIPSC